MRQPDIDAACCALSIAREEVGNERDRNPDAQVAKILADVSATIATAEKRLDRLRIARAQHADAMVGVRAVNAMFQAFGAPMDTELFDECTGKKKVAS